MNLLRLLRMVKSRCPSDTGFETRFLGFQGTVPVTKAPKNIETLRMSVGKTLYFFETLMH